MHHSVFEDEAVLFLEHKLSKTYFLANHETEFQLKIAKQS